MGVCSTILRVRQFAGNAAESLPAVIVSPLNPVSGNDSRTSPTMEVQNAGEQNTTSKQKLRRLGASDSLISGTNHDMSWEHIFS
jgi:hypothetical protein